jgi:hypothetical protein
MLHFFVILSGYKFKNLFSLVYILLLVATRIKFWHICFSQDYKIPIFILIYNHYLIRTSIRSVLSKRMKYIRTPIKISNGKYVSSIGFINEKVPNKANKLIDKTNIGCVRNVFLTR